MLEVGDMQVLVKGLYLVMASEETALTISRKEGSNARSPSNVKNERRKHVYAIRKDPSNYRSRKKKTNSSA